MTSNTDAGQHALVAEIARVRGYLTGTRSEPAGAGVHNAPRAPDATATHDAPDAADPSSSAALGTLVHTFGLSPFERDVLLLCAGAELDASFAAAVHDAGGITFGMALAILPNAHWSATTQTAPLRYWRLVSVASAATFASSPLRIDERVLHYLAGTDAVDEHLDGFIMPARPGSALEPSHERIASEIVAAWEGAAGAWPVVELVGTDIAARGAIAAAVCDAIGLRLFAMSGDTVPAAPESFELLRRLWRREALLSHAALLVEADPTDGGEPERARRLERFVGGVHGPTFVTRERPGAARERATFSFTVGRVPVGERRVAWEAAFGELARPLNGALDAVSAAFALPQPAMRAAAMQVQASVARGEPADDALWAAARSQARQGSSGLSTRIEPQATWNDLVLPDPQQRILLEIIVHVRHATTVYDRWGFAARATRGLGISALFAGPSGTGKTLAAEVIAHELRLDLLHVDLSQVVSKYIGETEKNLGRVFDAAEAGGAILLFDEADALFGKRSEVKDSHDRYANLEVSYLLQRIEAYRGLTILTTNLKKALDDAFIRRLRFVITFPFPDVAGRAEIWRRTIPAEAPTSSLDFDRLAQLNASGGTIRSVALHGAFIAADAGEPLGMPHLLAAAYRDYGKREQTLTEAEVRGWT